MKCILPALFAAAIVVADVGVAISQDKPNILWIVADDLGPDLGCYGNDLVYTPNLDRLASQGMKFTGMFTSTPVCSVSRSALITGMYPATIDCHQHRKQYKDSLPDGVKPVTEYFREAGYFVTNKGKTDYNFTHDRNEMYDGTDWSQRKEGQPFFAQIQIALPHRPFQRDPEHPIDPDRVKIAPYYPDHKISRKDWALYLETVQQMDKQVGAVLDRLDKEGLSENTIVFFFGDQGRPHVREKQFLYDGGLNTPLIVRWPNKIKPGTSSGRLVSSVDLAPTSLKAAGIEVPAHMHGYDIFGKKAREYVFASRDRMDETVDRIRAVRSDRYKYIRNFYPERPYTQFNAYKKHSYPTLTLMQVLHKRGELTPEQAFFMAPQRPAEELYDLKNDPFEVNNLAGIKETAKIQKRLSNALDDWLSAYDPGQYPEDPSEIEYAQKLMERLFEQEMNKKGLSPDISDEAFLEYWEKYLFGEEKANP